MRKLPVLLSLSMLMLPAAHAAEDLNNVEGLGQQQFRALSEDLGGVLSYKQLGPAEPMGLLGFDVGVDASWTEIEADQAWQAATGEDISGVPLARVRATKGLPFGFDVGGFYSTVPGSNIDAYGAELRYAILEGNVALPAIGVRGAYTEMSGVDDLDFETRSVDLSISKGLTFVTPYAGAGKVWVTSTPKGNAAAIGLQEEDFDDTRVFAGVRLTAMPFMLTLEGEQTGDIRTYSAKFAIGF